jgi:hypothetical protein
MGLRSQADLNHLGYVAAPVVHHWGLISLGHAIFTRTDLNHLGYFYGILPRRITGSDAV